MVEHSLSGLWRNLQPEEKAVPIVHVPILRINHARVGGREWRALIRPGIQVARNLQLVIRGESEIAERWLDRLD